MFYHIFWHKTLLETHLPKTFWLLFDCWQKDCNLAHVQDGCLLAVIWSHKAFQYVSTWKVSEYVFYMRHFLQIIIWRHFDLLCTGLYLPMNRRKATEKRIWLDLGCIDCPQVVNKTGCTGILSCQISWIIYFSPLEKQCSVLRFTHKASWVHSIKGIYFDSVLHTYFLGDFDRFWPLLTVFKRMI